jgi:PAS domain S-box-containing protein
MLNSIHRHKSLAQARQLQSPVTLSELVPRSNGDIRKEAEHFVQFYEADAFLLNSLRDFIHAGLEAGEVCIVLATKAHREALNQGLEAIGVSVSEAQTAGQYLAWDAAETLAKLMEGDALAPERFTERVGGIVTQAAQGQRRVRIFGELVALLWASGNPSAAIQLEELWGSLQQTQSFLLFCAYPMNAVRGTAHAPLFDRVCALHSSVIPTESYTTLADPDDQLRMIVELQQQARSLQVEIEERKQIEEQLRRSQRELTDFVENAVVGLHWVGPDGTILWANRAEMDMLGYSREEYIGRHITEFHADPEVINDILNFLNTGQEVHNYEARLRCKDGTLKHVLIDSNVYREEGRFIHTRCFTRDITERRFAEQALRERDEWVRQLLSLLPAAVYTCDREGFITYYNQRAAELWGREPKLGDSCERFCGAYRLRRLDGSTLLHVDTPMAAAVKTGEATRDEEVVIERPDGSEIVVSVNIDPLFDRAGQRCGAVNVFQDISTRKRAEEALKQANRRKDEFLAMLAHELRNPLAPIRSAIQLLHRLGPPEPQLQLLRDIIDRQVQHLTRLVDDLLDASRITQGKVVLNQERLELRSVVGRALETSRPLIEARNHQLQLSLPQEPLWLEGDLVRLSQVVANLLNNAAKYTEQGGHIWLEAERAGAEIVLRVRDNGMGIPASLLPHVFDLFTQAERSLDRSEGGLGVGLALVRSLVELHGGCVEAFSAGPGQGSEFVVHLPILPEAIQREESAPAFSTSSSRKDKTGRRVLVVDDNLDSAESMALLLQLGGHQVQVAHDGQAALEIAQRFQPQVVLLDIGLPKLNGYEVARRLRSWPDMQKAVLIALTGYGQAEDHHLSQQAGFNHHLTKPADPVRVEWLIDSLALD